MCSKAEYPTILIVLQMVLLTVSLTLNAVFVVIIYNQHVSNLIALQAAEIKE